MNLYDLVKEANHIADEDEDLEIVTGFLNAAISKINVECNAVFPYLSVDSPSSEYVGFPDKWQRALLIPFAVGRIKQRDSSQFEYSDAYSEFFANLQLFKSKYRIPDEYKDNDAETGSYQIDFNQNMFRWNNRGSGFSPLD